MSNHFIRFIEEDVDGCGTNAEVLVLLRTEFPLTYGHKARLKQAIEDIKNELEEDGWDTDSVVEEAVTRVFGTDAKVKVVVPDIEIEF